jgi:hypothetical protein
MGFIKLNRYGDPSGSTFDPEAVVKKVCESFAGVKVLPGDQLTLTADRAAAYGAADHVVKTLRRNEQAYGPAYAFEIGIPGGGAVEGRARRYDVSFLFPDPLAEEWQARLMSFLRSLGQGRIEMSAEVGTKGA